MTTVQSKALEVGDWVVFEKLGIRRVSSLQPKRNDVEGTRFTIEGGDNIFHWLRAQRYATPKEIEAHPIKEGDWVSTRGSEDREFPAVQIKHGSLLRPQVMIVWRHATPEEYRKGVGIRSEKNAAQAKQEADLRYEDLQPREDLPCIVRKGWDSIDYNPKNMPSEVLTGRKGGRAYLRGDWEIIIFQDCNSAYEHFSLWKKDIGFIRTDDDIEQLMIWSEEMFPVKDNQ